MAFDVEPGPSGPGRYVEAILNALDPEEFEIMFVSECLSGKGDGDAPVRREIEIPPEQCERQRATRTGWRLGRYGRLAWRLIPGAPRVWAGFGRDVLRAARLLKGRGIDLFHAQSTGCEEAPVAARLAGIPRVLGTFHVDPSYDLDGTRSGPGHRLLESLSNHCLHRAIAVSDATKRDWVRRTRLRDARVVTIHNGVNPERFRPTRDGGPARRALGLPDDGRLIVGGVGRLDRAKGFTYLIEAAGLLAGAYPNLMLVLAGAGAERAALGAQAERLGLGGRVRFLGFSPDVNTVYEALDVFVLPSLCETLGYAFLEAMAKELPTVGTRVGGVPEVIEPERTGFLVPPRDGEALAAALRPLLESEELRRRLGRAGRQRVIRHFSETDCAARTIQLYREMLAERFPSTALRPEKNVPQNGGR